MAWQLQGDMIVSGTEMQSIWENLCSIHNPLTLWISQYILFILFIWIYYVTECNIGLPFPIHCPNFCLPLPGLKIIVCKQMMSDHNQHSSSQMAHRPAVNWSMLISLIQLVMMSGHWTAFIFSFIYHNQLLEMMISMFRVSPEISHWLHFKHPDPANKTIYRFLFLLITITVLIILMIIF